MRYRSSEFNIKFNFQKPFKEEDVPEKHQNRVESLFLIIEQNFDTHKRSVYGRSQEFLIFNRDDCKIFFDDVRHP